MKDNTVQLMNFHYVLMGLMMVFGIIGLFMSFVAPGEAGALMPRTLIYLFQIVALACGFVHLLSLYSKSASLFYKLFMLFTALSYAAYAWWVLGTYGFNVGVVLGIVCVAILAALAFWPNLGKQVSWYLFGIFFFIVLLCAVASFGISLQSAVTLGSVVTVIAGTVARLVIGVTVGLSLKGKYDNKDARGTV